MTTYKHHVTVVLGDELTASVKRLLKILNQQDPKIPRWTMSQFIRAAVVALETKYNAKFKHLPDMTDEEEEEDTNE